MASIVNEFSKFKLSKEISNPSGQSIFNAEVTFLLSTKTEIVDDDFDTIVSSKLIDVLSTIIEGISGIISSLEESSLPPQAVNITKVINNIKNLNLITIYLPFYNNFQSFLQIFFSFQFLLVQFGIYLCKI